MTETWMQQVWRFRSSPSFITFVVAYAILVDQLFFTVILPVLPFSLVERSRIPQVEVQYWTTSEISVYGGACFALSPLIGWLVDRHASRRVLFAAALLALTGSAILMWLSRPIWCQILSRVIQGLAASMVYIIGLAIIVDTVGTDRVGQYMGHVAIAMNLGSFAGPLLGGIVYNVAGYDAVWSMMLGFVGLDILLRFLMREKGHGKITAATGSDTGMTINLLQREGERSPPIKRSTAKLSRRSLPTIVTLLFSMRMDVALYGIFVQALIFSGFETVLSIYLMEIWNYSSLGAGLFFLPLTLPALLAPLLGRMVDRNGPRSAIVAGFSSLCPTLILMRFVDHDTTGQKVLMATLLFLVGLGITATLDPLMAEISYVVKEKEKCSPERYQQGAGSYGQAYALFNMAWAAGNVAGPLVAGLVREQAGWATMGWTLGLMAGISAIPCALWSGDAWSKSGRSRSEVV